MADVIITIRVMPESPETDIAVLEGGLSKIISEYSGKNISFKKEPFAFGLISLVVNFIVNEDKGSTDDMEEALSKVEGVESVSVIGVTRAFG